jgi:hypothetical protein
MKPEINKTSFGSITIDGITYDHDIIIRKNGDIEKRKKKLSKAIYGTSHTVSLDEMKFVYEEGIEGIIVGTGQYGVLKLSEEAVNLLSNRKCPLHMFPTPEAINHWNGQEGSYIGLFHVTC